MLCFFKRGQWRSTTYCAQSIVRVFACCKRRTPGLVLCNDFLIHACDTPTFILVLEIFRNAFFLSGTMRLLFTSERRIHSVWFAHGRGGDWGPEKWLLQKTPQSNKHKGNDTTNHECIDWSIMLRVQRKKKTFTTYPLWHLLHALRLSLTTISHEVIAATV